MLCLVTLVALIGTMLVLPGSTPASAEIIPAPTTGSYNVSGQGLTAVTIGNSELVETGGSNNCGIIDESSANLNLPAGANVVKAFLYWGGLVTDTSAGLPLADFTGVTYKIGSGTAQALTGSGSTVYTDNSGTPNRDYKLRRDDITTFVNTPANHAKGSTQRYTVNLTGGQVSRCAGSEGGARNWHLTVVYTDTALGTANTVSIFDGLKTVSSAAPYTATVTYTASPAAAAGKLTSVVWQGDAATGETLATGDGSGLPDFAASYADGSTAPGLDIDTISGTHSTGTSMTLGYTTTTDTILAVSAVLTVPRSALSVKSTSLSSTVVKVASTATTAQYQIVATNPGPGTVTGVGVTSTLDVGFNHASTGTVTLGGGATRPSTTNPAANATGTLTWSSFTIPAGGTVTIPFTANVLAATATGTYQNAASATATGVQIIAYGSGDSNTDDLTLVAANPTLRLTKATTTATVSRYVGVDAEATFKITAKNPSGASISGVTINDTLPGSLTYLSTTSVTLLGGSTRPTTTDPTVGAGVPAWSSFTIPAAGSVEITFRAKIPAASAQSVFQNPASGTASSGTVIAYASTNRGDDVAYTDAPQLAVITTHSATPLPMYSGVDATATYTVTVSNASALVYSGVSIADTLPTGFTYLAATSVTPASGSYRSTVANPTVGAAIPTWGSFTIGAGSSVTIVFTAKVPAATALGTYQNSASATSATTGLITNYAGASSTGDEVILQAGATLSLSKSTSTSSVDLLAGAAGTATYTITATNASAATFPNVTIADTLPGSLTYLATTSVTPAAGSSRTSTVDPTAGTGTPSWGIFSVGAGSSVTIVFTANIPAGTAASTLQNPASATSSSPGNITNYSSGSTTNDDVTVVPRARVTMTKTTSTANVSRSPGAATQATYTVVATNDTAVAYPGVTITDTLPSGFTYLSTSSVALGGTSARTTTVDPSVGATTPAWGTFSVGANSTVTIVFVANIPSSVAVGTYNNSVTASSGTAGTIVAFVGTASSTDNVTLSQTAVVDLVVTKTTSTASVLGYASVDGEATYTITVTNNSAIAQTSVRLQDTLPSGFTYLSTTSVALGLGSRTGTENPTAGTSTPEWGVFTVGIGSTVSVTFKAKIAAGTAFATYNNSASATAPAPSSGPTEWYVHSANGAYSNQKYWNVANGSWPPVVVTPSTGRTHVRLTLRASGTVVWTNLNLAPNDTNYVNIGTYVSGSPTGWFTIDMPISAWPGGAFTNVDRMQIQNIGTTYGFDVGLIQFVDLSTSTAAFTWFGNGTGARSIDAGGGSMTYTTGGGGGSAPTITNYVGTSSTSDDVAYVAGPTLTLVKSTSTASVFQGAEATYTITATNSSTVAYTGVSISDTLPASFTYASTTSVTPAAGSSRTAVVDPTVGSGTPSWGTFTVGAGSSVTIVFKALVPVSTAVGTYQNPASASSASTGLITPYASGSTTNEDVSVVALPSLTVTKSTSTPSVDTYPGVDSEAIYTLTATNSAGTSFTSVSISDTLPSGFTYLSTTSVALGGTSSRTAVVNPTVGAASPAWGTFTVGGNSNVVIVFKAKITAGTAAGTYNNSATASSGSAGTIIGYVGSSSAAEDVTLVARPTLTVTKATTTPSVDGYAGVDAQAIYTITASNPTGVAFTGVSISDTLPSGFTFLEVTSVTPAAGSTRTAVSNPTVGATTPVWGTFTIGANSNVAITFKAKIAAGTAFGVYNNSASATSASTGLITGFVGSGSSADDVTYVARPTLTLAKSTSTASVLQGATATYTITATNSSTVAFTGVSIADTLPASLTYASTTSITPVGGSSRTAVVDPTVGTGVPTWGTFTVGAGSSVTIVFTALVPVATATGTYQNPASATSASTGLITNYASASTTNEDVLVGPRPVITVAKSTSTSSVDMYPGVDSQATYTITASNSTATPLSGVSISDALPAGFTYLSTSSVTPSGTSTRTSTVDPTVGATSPSWGTFTIGGNSNVVIVFTAKIASATAAGTYNNSASASTASAATINNYVGTASTTDDVTLVARPTMLVTKAATTPLVTIYSGADAEATYTITASNTSGVPFTGVSLSDALPAGFTYLSTTNVSLGGTSTRTATSDPTVGSTTPSWGTFTVGANSVVAVTFKAKIVAGTAAGTYNNSATASSASTGQITGYVGSSSTSDDVVLTVGTSLTVAKATSTPSVDVYPGVDAEATYTITVTNAVAVAYSGLSISDALPAGFTYLSTTSTTGTRSSVVDPVVGSATPSWGTFTVAASGSVSVTFRVKIAAGTTVATYNNSASAVVTSSDPAQWYVHSEPGGYVNQKYWNVAAGNWPPAVVTPSTGRTHVRLTLRASGTVVWNNLKLGTKDANYVTIGTYVSGTPSGWFTVDMPISAWTAGSFANIEFVQIQNIGGSTYGYDVGGIEFVDLSTSTAAFTWFGASTGARSVDAGSGSMTYTTGSGGGSGATVTNYVGSSSTAEDVTLVARPKLVITKVTSTPSIDAYPNETYDATYTVTASNPSTVAYGGVTITDTLPAGFTYLSTTSVSPAAGSTRTSATDPTAASTTPAWGTFSVGAGSSVVIVFTARVGVATPFGVHNNSATATSGSTGLIVGFVGSSSTTDDVTLVARPVLTVAKDTTTPTVSVSATTGTEATYRIVATNTASVSYSGVSIADALPAGFTYASTTSVTTAVGSSRDTTVNPTAGSTTPSWGSFTVGAGSSVTVVFKAFVPGGTVEATYQNSASASSAAAGRIVNYDGASSNAENVSVAYLPVLNVAKSTSTPAVTLSTSSPSEAVYSITATNSATSAFANVSLTDTLPSGFTYLSTTQVTLGAGSSRGTTANPTVGSTVPSWGVFSVAAGSSVTIVFVASVASGTTPAVYQNSATATSTSPGSINPYASGSSSAEDVTVSAAAGLSLNKITSTSSVVMASGTNGEAVYSLTITNTSTVALSAVSVQDALPAGFVFGSTTLVSFTGGATRSTTVEPTVGATSPSWGSFSMPGGSTATVTYRAAIASGTALGTYQGNAATSGTVGSGNTVSAAFVTATSAADNVTLTSASVFNGAVTGTVFRDYNYNGTRDNRGNLAADQPAARIAAGLEPGEAAITITATDSAGAQWTSTSSADGSYSLSITNASSEKLRVEMTIPSLKAFLQPGVALDGNSDGDVRFMKVNDAGVNFAVSNPAEYCKNSATLRLVTSCWKYGDQKFGTAKSVLDSFPYNASSPTPTSNVSEASENQIGTTYGLAFDPARQNLFAAAYYRRHAGLGPAGTGAVYKITQPGTGSKTVSVWADLNDLFGSGTAGVDKHPDPSFGASGDRPYLAAHNPTVGESKWYYDVESFDLVGKVSLGDMDISEDNANLFVVNLADKKLYRMSAVNAPTSASQVANVAIPDAANCPNPLSDSRPMAVTLHDGKGYVGVMCTGQSTQTRTNLGAYVFQFDPVTMVFNPTPVSQMNLGTMVSSYAQPSDPAYESLRYSWWRSDLPPTIDSAFHSAWTSLSFASIAFDNNDMIFGFRNRFMDQIGEGTGDLIEGSGTRANPFWRARGGIYRACANSSGGWTMEAGTGSGYACGSLDFHSGNYGPTGENLYHNNQNLTNGGMVLLQGTQSNPLSLPAPGNIWSGNGGGRLVVTTPDVAASWSNGVRQYSAQFGVLPSNGSYALYNGTDLSVTHPHFGKANGLGDLEVLCGGAPITIGNRVWLDADGDGVQDADEVGIGGLTVQLMQGTDPAAKSSAITADDGTFFFTSGSDPTPATTSTSQKYDVTTLAFGQANLWVKVPTDIEVSGVSPRVGSSAAIVGNVVIKQAGTPLVLSPTTAGSSGSLDSDALGDGGTSRFTLTENGENNHAIDFGFTVGGSGAAPLYAIGDTVWEDDNNDGIYSSAAEFGSSGITVQLLRASDNVVLASTTTNASGKYAFDALAEGSYKVRFSGLSSVGTWSVKNSASTTADTDSDPDPTTGTTDVIVLNSSASAVTAADILVTRATKMIRNIDAGLYEPAGGDPATLLCLLPT